MPETNAIERIVLRKDSLTEEEWLTLISNRVEHMRPIMDRVTLIRLGDIQMRVSQKIEDRRWFEAPNHGEHILDQQGVYEIKLAGLECVIWGMLRNTTWFAIELRQMTCYKSLEATPSLLNKEYGISYNEMWCLLSRSVHAFTEQRREWLRTLEQLERKFEHEDSLIKQFV
jgi:hypothetical protein